VGGAFVTVPVSPESAATAPEPTPARPETTAIRGRSPAQIAWRRLRRDKVAMAGGVIVVLFALAAILAPILVKYLGHPPNDYHESLINPELAGAPNAPLGGINSHYLLGVEPGTGRDVFSRILYGGQISLLIAVLATAVSVTIGIFFGIIAGYFGGWVDAVIARAMDLFLAFPLLVFAIALTGVVQNEAFGLTGNTLHISVLIFVIGFFNWPYMGRIIRGQTLSLRNREYVDAARSLGARGSYILWRELLPNLMGPILVYATLLIPQNILFEAALDFLGVGIHPPTPSWGQMLATAVPIYQADPWFMLMPGLAIGITVLAFNLFGDGLRDALDPKSTR
jgi:peptide/nickel transport system permease protein/oligopeptide transport system permease protein